MRPVFNPITGEFDFVNEAGVSTTGGKMTGTLEISVADNTKAVILSDDASEEWLSAKRVGDTVTLDLPSTEPTNELLNPTFDTDLTNWSEEDNLFFDEFGGDLSAWTETDTNSKISIISGELDFATGAAVNDGLWGASRTRANGRVLLWKVKPSDTNGIINVGWDTNSSGAINDRLIFAASGVLQLVSNGGTAFTVGAYTAGTYYVAAAMRSTGLYWLIKGEAYTDWSLIGITAAGTAAGLPAITAGSTTSIFKADDARIPDVLWLIDMLCYDTFTRADGAIGNSETTGPDSQTTPSLAWTGGAISTNKNVITPSQTEKLTNGDFALWTGDNPNSWSVYGESGTDPEISEVGTGEGHGGVGTGFANLYTSSGNTYISQSPMTIGRWYDASILVNTVTSGSIKLIGTSVTYKSGINSVGTHRACFRAEGTVFKVQRDTTPTDITFDDVSLKELTLSSLFSSVSTSDADVIADANVTLTAGTQAGLVLNLDSTSSPANFLIAYHDGTNVRLDKCVGGTYTSLISAAATYSAGATLRVITYTSGGSLKVRVYYDNVMIGSEQTVSDAGIISNTKHGLFSTYSGNSFDNFTLWPRGSSATKYTSAPFEELTATRDTGTKYAGAASVKLVAGGTDGNYLQSVNVGDTSSYTFIAYAYTDGSAVTSADLELYYDGAVLSTTFTSMGGGWYKLTGSLTGVASAKDFGVRVKAGVTVYCDSFSLQAGSGDTITLKILNSGTGLLLMQLADGLPEYADNAAAVTAGLGVGTFYRTGDATKVVH